MEIKEIALGRGEYIINHGSSQNRKAIFIEPAPTAGIVGDDAPGMLNQKELAEGTLIITFDSIESAQVLIDAINSALNI